MTKYKLAFLLACIFFGLCWELYFGGFITSTIWEINDYYKGYRPVSSITNHKKTNKPSWKIHINLDTRNLYLYHNEIIKKTYPISGGKASTPSPEGRWTIIEKNTWGGAFGGWWMGLDVPWGTYGIHGTRQPWIIGHYNVSGGCIRMKNEQAEELYSFVPLGTPVTIDHPNRIPRELRTGEIGSDVLEMQEALNKLNYYSGPLDGKFGMDLREAVISFQKDNNLYANGVINKLTYELITKRVSYSFISGSISKALFASFGSNSVSTIWPSK